jgi:Esterase/lipase
MSERSKEAAVAEQVMLEYGAKKRLLDAKGMQESIDACFKINDQPYEVPESRLLMIPGFEKYMHDITGKVGKTLEYGMEILHLNDSGSSDDPRVIVYLHGGAYVYQPYYEHIAMVERLAQESGARAIMPMYPMAPKYNCHESYAAVLKYYENLILTEDHESLVLMGDSAGGAIALALTQYLKKNSLPMPGRLILISPWLDARCDNPQIDELGIEAIDPMLTKQFYLAAQYWADGLPLDDPLISPAYGPLDGLPPITLYTGTREIFWPDAVKFNEKAKRCGADVDYREWDGMNHAFPLYPIPEAVAAQDEIIEMLRDY